MAMEPERPVEKMLRDYAKKRREEAGAPLELHAATRRLLQGEVARRRAKNQGQPQSFAKLLLAAWPRIAAAIGLFAVLVFVVSVWLPGRNRPKGQFDLAQNERAAGAAPSNEPRPVAGALPEVAPADNLAAPTDLGLAYADRAQPQQDKDAIASGTARPGFRGGAERPAEMRTVLKSSPSDAFKQTDEVKLARNQPAPTPSVAQKILPAPKYEPAPSQSAANARRTEAAPPAATPPLTVAENDSKRAYLKAKASATNTLEESQTTSG